MFRLLAVIIFDIQIVPHLALGSEVFFIHSQSLPGLLFLKIGSLLFHMTECSRIIFYISCPNLELFVFAKLWKFFLVEMVLRDHNLSATSVHCLSWSFFPDLFRGHN